MADALLGVLAENLLSLSKTGLATVSGIKGKAKKLSSTLQYIKAVVEDAEDKQITDKSIKVWLQQVKEAAYVLDDILDECSIESHRLAGLSTLKPNNIMFRWKIGHRLEEITRRFDHIADDRKNFSLQESVRGRRDEVADYDEERETLAIIHEQQVYGRQGDQEKIVEFLLSEERHSALLSVYPIVGLGGMGKTTLSRMVYNHALVSSTFSRKIWICVSENFCVKRILRSIVESITGRKCNDLDFGIIHKKVQELLQSKRYLLVLDDVWNESEKLKVGLSKEKWNLLKSALSCGSKGASVLVSTRDMDVAKTMGTCQAHYLQCLSENDCWLLFKQCAFGDLVDIGKEIVKKCGGSPLAARALGGLLHLKNENKEWLEVKESRLWDLPDGLRQCFAFCAIFPKDTEIIKEELIELWMAKWVYLTYEKQGGRRCREFNLEGIVSKVILILDSANMTNLPANTHHVFYSSSEEEISFKKGTFKNAESLRTLYQLNHFNKKNYDCLPTHRSLRVLQTSSSNPSIITREFNSFEKLEILKLRKLSKLICHLSPLQNLRHLVIEDCDSLSCMFPNIRKLSSLRTLSVYIVSVNSLVELHDLKLGGDLHIKGLENVCRLSEAEEANLKDKNNLDKLIMSWGSSEETKSHATNPDQVLEGLQPHSNLRKLELHGYAGLKSPSWIGMLSNLVELELSNCNMCMSLSSLGKLPSLRKLNLWDVNNMKYIDDDESYSGVAFPCLQWCNLQKLERLLKVRKGEMFTRLSKLYIANCPELELPSCIPSVTSLCLIDFTNEVLRSVSRFSGITSLVLNHGQEDLAYSFPLGGTWTSLKIIYFKGLKELPKELFTNLNALEELEMTQLCISILDSFHLHNFWLTGCCASIILTGITHLSEISF